ncbi:Cyclin, C-terminal domain [Musa troglodytarum]|uniref:Cyclin, C-terminal domain n=1 Tax=Musa troglodytarum TaxID=320322 RepID=A0A9E7KHZ3_9LILI|nr:Cyclin, C-terminal domain [Musa troglodytarum]
MPPILADDRDLSILYAQEDGRPREYMDFQVEIDEKKRSLVADRLIEVHHTYGLMPETLYLTFQILDRYLSKERVLGTELLLVGVSALLVASKYEEPRPRKVHIRLIVVSLGATAGQIRKAAVRGGAARKRGVDLNEGDRLVGGPDPLANPMPSRRFSARLLAKARLAVLVERPEVAADYIVKEKKDSRESGSLRSDSPDDKGNSMIDSRKKNGTPALASALTVQNKKCGRPCKYMDFQVDINEEKRSIVADRLIEVHHSFGLMPETLYLTFHIIDQYLSKEKVSGTELPLVGINALLIASKYEESRPQKNIDYGDILRHAYTKEQMLAKERDIKWKLSVPTQYVFLVCFLKAAAMCDKEFSSAQAAIVNSQTLEEVARLEKALKLGQIPEEFMNLGKETTTASGDAAVDGMDTDDQNEVTEAQDQEQNEEAQPIEQRKKGEEDTGETLESSFAASCSRSSSRLLFRGEKPLSEGEKRADRWLQGVRHVLVVLLLLVQVLPLDKFAKRLPDPLANPMPSRRFSARLLAKARLAVLVERPEVAADYIVKEKKDGRESGSLRNDSPDDKGNSMIDSRKKTGTPALASALTVQNKDDGVHSIDALEVLAVVDYVDNIYDFYRHAEKCGRPCKYMDFQVDINEEKRSIVADRLIEVHHSFGLMPETLYLTFHIIDQYLSKAKVSGTELPLVGINALLIASKYEESRPQKNIDYGDILRHAYTKEQMLAKERDIMKTLKWKLSVPTQFVFLLEHMVFFLAELGLMHYSMITYWPSVAAASAVYAARSTLKRTPLWTQTLMHHTGYLEHQLRKCAQQLVIFHSSAAESRLQAVYKKYSSTRFGAVALLPPATELLRSKEVTSS